MNIRFPSLNEEIQKLIKSPFEQLGKTSSMAGGVNVIYFEEISVKYEEFEAKQLSQGQSKEQEVQTSGPNLSIAISQQNSCKYVKIEDSIEALRMTSVASNDEKKIAQTDQEILDTTFIQKIIAHGRNSKNNYIKISPRLNSDLARFFLDPENHHLKINLKEILAQMILALFALHSKNLVHKDINHKNFLINITKDGEIHVVLADLDTIAKDDAPAKYMISTREYRSQELEEIQKIYTLKDGLLEQYNKLNKKAIDCYALGQLFHALICFLNSDRYQISAKESNDVKAIPQSTDELKTNDKGQMTSEEHDNLKHLINNLKNGQVSKRFSIEQAMDHPYFGETSELRKEYFKKVNEKFKKQEIYFDGYYQLPSEQYSKSNDGFNALSKNHKEIYLEAVNLQEILDLYEQNKETKPQDPSLLMHIAMKAKKLYKLSEAASFSPLVKQIQTKAKLILDAIPSEVKIELVPPISYKHLMEIVKNTHERYISVNGLQTLEKGPRFFERFYSHGVTGKKNADKFLKVIEEFSSPLDAYLAIYLYIEKGTGRTGTTSFRTILSQELNNYFRCPHELIIKKLQTSSDSSREKMRSLR